MGVQRSKVVVPRTPDAFDVSILYKNIMPCLLLEEGRHHASRICRTRPDRTGAKPLLELAAEDVHGRLLT